MQPGVIWISNHHDRWLKLVLSIPSASVNLVQHGRLAYFLPNGERLNYVRNPKIKGVTSIYAFDNFSEKLFSDYLDSLYLNFFRLKVSLSIMPWREERANYVKILVIGGPTNLQFYLELMDAIFGSITQRVDLVLRHHPLQKKRLTELRRQHDYLELLHDESVPEPDLIISYGSSIDDHLLDIFEAKLILYPWSDSVYIPEIVKRVQKAVIDLKGY